MIRYYIGIDPAFRKNGFAAAIIDKETKSISYIQFKHGFLEFSHWLVHKAPERNKTLICVENSNLQNTSFDVRGNVYQVARKSRDVGKNQAVSQNVFDLCYMLGYSTINLSPLKKGMKWNHTTLEQVLSKEGIKTGKTNQDKRDAAKLALIAIKKPFLAVQKKK